MTFEGQQDKKAKKFKIVMSGQFRTLHVPKDTYNTKIPEIKMLQLKRPKCTQAENGKDTNVLQLRTAKVQMYF